MFLLPHPPSGPSEQPACESLSCMAMPLSALRYSLPGSCSPPFPRLILACVASLTSVSPSEYSLLHRLCHLCPPHFGALLYVPVMQRDIGMARAWATVLVCGGCPAQTNLGHSQLSLLGSHTEEFGVACLSSREGAAGAPLHHPGSSTGFSRN